jgi:hypothetical protein
MKLETNQPASPQHGWAAWSLIGVSIAALLVVGGNTIAEHSSLDHGIGIAAESEVDGAIVVEMQEMRFIPDVIEVKPGEEVVLNLINRDDMAHDLKVNNASSGRILPGQNAELNIGVIEKDTEGWCTIAGHRSQGMVLNFKVSASEVDQ